MRKNSYFCMPTKELGNASSISIIWLPLFVYRYDGTIVKWFSHSGYLNLLLLLGRYFFNLRWSNSRNSENNLVEESVIITWINLMWYISQYLKVLFSISISQRGKKCRRSSFVGKQLVTYWCEWHKIEMHLNIML